MKPLFVRYYEYITNQFSDELGYNTSYSIEKLPNLPSIKRILFTGMGCSAVVSDLIKGFFQEESLPVKIDVINDYHIERFVDDLTDTLVIVSSYSGRSQESIFAYERFRKLTDTVIALTTGGPLAEASKDHGLIRWKLINPDPQYPLFHVPQYFASLLNLFYELKIINSNYSNELEKTKKFLVGQKNSLDITLNKNIILLSSPKWHYLLRLLMMHFNEIAKIPTHRNLFHEFTHSEIAGLTKPHTSTVLIFSDEEDQYTLDKIQNLQKLLGCVEVIDVHQETYLEKLFGTLQLIQYLTFRVANESHLEEKKLISLASGNSWYNK